ncbi:MAG: hypothetical protein DWQ34_06615 [Planctomycetota bacterium]|nr:MAG: hypothetical protein DWQ29_07605 [Planctomycetota bacterium]REJ95195.1 MAG: hypothetical protein DWQ34_06615 [Planctomycetota bacterium]REK25040.1 MAG: hypothetical protein DWQ41_12765 [Planctomycetota bacterium]REK28104.1 MAG: hypothetical protein DWQ45_25090 [Planctomycetota bacterium]
MLSLLTCRVVVNVVGEPPLPLPAPLAAPPPDEPPLADQAPSGSIVSSNSVYEPPAEMSTSYAPPVSSQPVWTSIIVDGCVGVTSFCPLRLTSARYSRVSPSECAMSISI